MGVLSRLIIGNDKNIEKRNMIWNMIGSFLYAFASMVLTMAVIALVGDQKGGIFTFAFTAFGQQMFTVAYFGIRPFQITDVEQRYSFGDYLHFRFLSCGTALIMGLVFVLMSDGYTYEKAMTVFLMVCYKVIDGFADTYEAEFQRCGRLYLTGKANTFRTLLSAGVFVTVLAVSRNLVAASGAAVAAQVAGVLIFDIGVIRLLPQVDFNSSWTKCKGLFQDCFLLFISVFLDFYIFSAAKYAIEANLNDTSMAVYGAVFMPTSVINLAAGFVIRPFLTELSFRWERKEFKLFLGIVRRLFFIILGLTVLAVGGAWFLGIPVLSILYGNIKQELELCRLSLVLIILGGGFNAWLNLFYYTQIIMKCQKWIFAGYLTVALAAVVLSPMFVRLGGIQGGAFSYLLLMILLAAWFAASTMYVYRKEKKKHGYKK